MAVALLLAGCGGGGAGSPAGADAVLSVSDVTIDRPANPKVGAVRMVVHNRTGEADALVAISTPVAERAQVHRTEIDEQGQASMVEVDRLEVAARSSVTFEPSGLHVMLSGLTTRLEVGDEVPLTLTFAQAGELEAMAKVVEPGTLGFGSDDRPADDEQDEHGH